MKLQQLRSASEVVAQGFSLTRAAERLNGSQPGITHQLQQLESELGVVIFVRNGRRISGLTSAGRTLMPIIARVLRGTADLQRVSTELAHGAAGEVTVATIYTHARYFLPQHIKQFVRDRPTVRLRLLQGTREEVAAWVSSGEVDFSVAGAPRGDFSDLEFHPCYTVNRVLLTRHDHPLAKLGKVRLEDIAKWPMITYDHAFGVWSEMVRAFERAGQQVNLVLTAFDADLLKTYVRSGLGIGIVADVAVDARADRDLKAIDCRHLFPSTTVHLGVRRGDVLSPQALHLIGLFSPKLRRLLSINQGVNS